MSLYQKYRPQTLSEMVGNEEVIKSIREHFSQEDPSRISHCHIFYGGSGVGKTTIARAIATEILGADLQFSVHEINTADNRGIDTARGIIDQMRGFPLKGKSTIFVIDECFPGDTEILTDQGFKAFQDLDKTEKIAQYNNDGTVEFVEPIRHIQKKHSGDMYSWNPFKNRTICMTPNHVQPLVCGKNNEIQESYIKDTVFCQTRKLIVSGSGAGSKDVLTALDRMAILSQADGAINWMGVESNRWIISFKKERKIKRFLKIAKEAEKEGYPIKLNEVKATNRPGYKRYTYSLPKDITKDLRTHFDLNVSAKYANDFINELVEWDGYKYENKKYLYYSSTNKGNVDFCSAMAFLCGYRSNIAESVDNRSDKFNNTYRLTIIKQQLHTTQLARKTKSTYKYSGDVYCVEVPSHKIIVRASGQFPFVTGNCHGMTPDAKRAFLKPTEDMPEHVYFFFCTTNLAQFIKGDEGKALNTRSTQWKLESLNARQMGKLVLRTAEAENFNVDDKVLSAIVDVADGSPRAALVALEKVMGIPDDIPAQLKILEKGGEEDPDTKAFCCAVCDSHPNWKKISELLRDMKGKVDAEQLRRGVLGYCTSIMLKNSNDHVAHVMEEFAVDTFATGFPGIVLAAYRCTK